MEYDQYMARDRQSEGHWNTLSSTFHALLHQLARLHQQLQSDPQPAAGSQSRAGSSSREEELAARLAATHEELRRAKSTRDILDVVRGKFGRGYAPGRAAAGWSWKDAKDRINKVLMQVRGAGDRGAGGWAETCSGLGRQGWVCTACCDSYML